jgi:hypothetical protein
VKGEGSLRVRTDLDSSEMHWVHEQLHAEVEVKLGNSPVRVVSCRSPSSSGSPGVCDKNPNINDKSSGLERARWDAG